MIFKRKAIYISLIIGICIYSNIGLAQDQKEKKKISFRHPDDNALDISSFLLDHHGVMPVPIIITEPAIGYGGGLGLLYFHQRKKQYDHYVPPSISGAFGFGTANKTWGTGLFHMQIFGDDRVRTLTAGAKVNVNYKYYGNNSELLSKYPPTVKMDAWVAFQQVQARIGQSEFYLGASYLYMNSQVALDTIPGKPLINYIIERLKGHSVISIIKPMAIYDNRNNFFTPTKGFNAELAYSYSASWLGSDADYGIIHTDFYGYIPIGNKLFTGWRYNGSFLTGDAPFYAYPFVVLRGIPAMRYQSNNVIVLETEWRYQFYKRWSLVAFSGMGKAFADAESFNDIDLSYNFGTGLRVEIAKSLGMHSGIDFAWGDGKDFAFYIVIGSSW